MMADEEEGQEQDGSDSVLAIIWYTIQIDKICNSKHTSPKVGTKTCHIVF